MTDELFASEIAAFAALATAGVRETRWLGRSFDYRPSTESTNDDARALAREGAPHGTVVLADAQRAGRGRRGRVWHSPVGSNLYLSALVRPNLAVTDAPLLTLVTGLAVARACDRFVSAESVTVKWPNDVRVHRRKVAGILVEGAVRGDRLDSAIIGIGLNVREREWPSELRDKATCLEAHATGSVSRMDALLAVLTEAERAIDALLLGGSSRDALIRALRARCDTIESTVTIDAVSGRAIAIAEDGALVVERPDGRVVAVRAGEITE